MRNLNLFTGIRWRLISYYLVVIAVVVLVMGIFFISFLNVFYRDNLRANLFAQARLAAALVQEVEARNGPETDLDVLCVNIGQSLGLRVTLIAADGTVLGDSAENPLQMENHLNRVEIEEALQKGAGSASRYSSTLQKDMFYAALLISKDGPPQAEQRLLNGFIRLAVPLSEIHAAISKLQLFIFLALIVSTVAALLVGSALSVRITGPLRVISTAARSIAGGDFEPDLEVEGRDEMAGLARTIGEMGRSLNKKVQQILLEKNKLDAVINAADSGILMVDRKLRIELINPAAEKIFALPREDAVGAPVQSALRYYSLFENLKGVYDDGRPRYFELSLFYPRMITLQVSLVPVIGVRGDVMGVLALFHDITLLRSVEQMRSDFVANVSHELRTPLTAIKGYTETILHQDLTGEELSDFLDIVDRETGRLARLVDSLLDLSAIEGQKATVTKEAFDLVELCKKALLDLEEARCQKKITVQTSLPPQPVYVYGNQEWLRQALVNIIDNSIKYGYPEGIIKLSIQELKEIIAVEISDNGPGVPEADLPYLFERFYRVDKSRTRKSGGTGLGLAIVKHILEAHGASYVIESKPGGGTTFRFSLPRTKKQSGPDLL